MSVRNSLEKQQILILPRGVPNSPEDEIYLEKRKKPHLQQLIKIYKFLELRATCPKQKKIYRDNLYLSIKKFFNLYHEDYYG